MVVTKAEALKNLKEQLLKIKDNNLKQIQLVTSMADDYCGFAEDVVQLIVKHIKELPSDLKLIGMYVMDSIIKFSGDGTAKYRGLFSTELVKLFVNTFEKSPTSGRTNLYKLRSTWQPIFLKNTLFHLDTEVQLIDRKWPIFNDFTSQPKPIIEPEPLEAASQPIAEIEDVEVTNPSLNDIADLPQAAGGNNAGHFVVEGIVDTVTPIEKWKDCNFPELMMKNIRRDVYRIPKKIQCAMVPLILKGYDVVAHGDKENRMTSCFIMTIIAKCVEAKEEGVFLSRTGRPFALIICPSKKLAGECADKCREFAKYTGVSVILMHEKVQLKDRLKNLNQGCDIAFITPFCCFDLFGKKTFNGENLRFLVLNEAEKIFNDQKSINYIISTKHLFPEHDRRQTLILSEILTTSSRKNAQLLTSSKHCAYVRWIINQPEKRKIDGENNIEEEPSVKKHRPNEDLHNETWQTVNADKINKENDECSNRMANLENVVAALTQQICTFQQTIDSMVFTRKEEEHVVNTLRRKVAAFQLDLAEAQSSCNAGIVQMQNGHDKGNYIDPTTCRNTTQDAGTTQVANIKLEPYFSQDATNYASGEYEMKLKW